MKIGTAASGIGTATTINLTFVPQFLYWNNATAPQGLRVSVLGDGVICDLDAKGIQATSSMRLLGRVTSGFMIPLANGIVKGKNVEIVFTNGVAAAIEVFGISIANTGNVYIQSLKQLALAGSGAEFRNFAFLGMPDATVTDIITIGYSDGLVQKVDSAELKAILGLFMNDVNGTNVVGIDNFNAKLNYVQITPTANQIVHMVRFARVGDVSQDVY